MFLLSQYYKEYTAFIEAILQRMSYRSAKNDMKTI